MKAPTNKHPHTNTCTHTEYADNNINSKIIKLNQIKPNQAKSKIRKIHIQCDIHLKSYVMPMKMPILMKSE